MRRRAPPALLLCVPLLLGCPGGGGGGGSAQATVASYRQRLELQVDGKTVELPLERLNVYLVEDESYTETFELTGPGVMLAGELPAAVHIGYGEKWDLLVGKEVEIAAEGGDRAALEKSRLQLPGSDAAASARGRFTLRSVQPGFDAKTPLEGDIEVRLEDGRTLKGKLFVLGTSWG